MAGMEWYQITVIIIINQTNQSAIQLFAVSFNSVWIQLMALNQTSLIENKRQIN